jgi:CBS domain-containing protein
MGKWNLEFFESVLDLVDWTLPMRGNGGLSGIVTRYDLVRSISLGAAR